MQTNAGQVQDQVLYTRESFKNKFIPPPPTPPPLVSSH